MCDPRGRDCIEKNSLKTFDCNTTCVGIYADVQFVKKNMKDELKIWKAEEPVETEFKDTSESGFKKEFDKGTSMLLNQLLDLKNEVRLLRSGVPQQINDELLKRGVGENGRELDKEKYNVLIAEYIKFKAKHVKHFRLNPVAETSAFGETFSTF